VSGRGARNNNQPSFRFSTSLIARPAEIGSIQGCATRLSARLEMSSNEVWRKERCCGWMYGGVGGSQANRPAL
jgi:hypothetical protein